MRQSLYDLIFGQGQELNTKSNWVRLGRGELDEETTAKILAAGYASMRDDSKQKEEEDE